MVRGKTELGDKIKVSRVELTTFLLFTLKNSNNSQQFLLKNMETFWKLAWKQ